MQRGDWKLEETPSASLTWALRCSPAARSAACAKRSQDVVPACNGQDWASPPQPAAGSKPQCLHTAPTYHEYSKCPVGLMSRTPLPGLTWSILTWALQICLRLTSWDLKMHLLSLARVCHHHIAMLQHLPSLSVSAVPQH